MSLGKGEGDNVLAENIDVGLLFFGTIMEKSQRRVLEKDSRPTLTEKLFFQNSYDEINKLSTLGRLHRINRMRALNFQ